MACRLLQWIYGSVRSNYSKRGGFVSCKTCNAIRLHHNYNFKWNTIKIKWERSWSYTIKWSNTDAIDIQGLLYSQTQEPSPFLATNLQHKCFRKNRFPQKNMLIMYKSTHSIASHSCQQMYDIPSRQPPLITYASINTIDLSAQGHVTNGPRDQGSLCCKVVLWT